MKIQTKVLEPYYDWDGRKYMEFEGVGRVKVPFRYGRVMCRVEGLKTVQEYKKGDRAEITMEKKYWDGLEYWILHSIKEC